MSSLDCHGFWILVPRWYKLDELTVPDGYVTATKWRQRRIIARKISLNQWTCSVQRQPLSPCRRSWLHRIYVFLSRDLLGWSLNKDVKPTSIWSCNTNVYLNGKCFTNNQRFGAVQNVFILRFLRSVSNCSCRYRSGNEHGFIDELS